jgi:hypothetical protein
MVPLGIMAIKPQPFKLESLSSCRRGPFMIKLYGYGPAWDFPDCSPFVTKVDCYLRMVALPYTLVPWHALQDLQKAPKGKFPCIEDRAKKIADSAFIIA